MRYLAFVVLIVIVAAPTEAESASHLKAAHDVIVLSHMGEGTRQSDSAYVDWLLTTNPDLRRYQDIVRDYAHAVYDLRAIERETAESLTVLLTEADLRAVGQFLRTPAGHKWSASGPARQRIFGSMLDRRIDAGDAEFRRRLNVRAKELRRPAPAVGRLIPS